ncbi:MAG: hypothetical protein H6Q60_29 [Oscillospiraceae bacterium]|nr:hypothetical protein [Oscillospiraceae bacterium]
MAIQGISGIPNPAIFNHQNPGSETAMARDTHTAAAKLGSLQTSTAATADLISTALDAVTGKDTSAQMGRYTDLCTSLLSQQAKTASGLASYYDSSGNAAYFSSPSGTNVSISIDFAKGTLTSQGMTPAQAAQAVSASGDWGVDAVASRVMDMALTLAAGDIGDIALLEAAVMKGFQNAFALMGGESKAPGITAKTKEEIKKRFDFWREQGSLDGYVMAADDDDQSDAPDNLSDDPDDTI